MTTRDPQAIARSRRQSFLEVLDQFGSRHISDPDVQAELARYVANGWKPPAEPRQLPQRGFAPTKRKDYRS